MSPHHDVFGVQVDRAIAAGEAPDAGSIARIVSGQLSTLGAAGGAAAEAHLAERVLGLGPLASLAQDPEVTDVLVNGDGTVWVDRGRSVEPSGLRLGVGEARPLAVRLAGLAGRRLDDSQPWVDGMLPGGVRLHAVLPPIAVGGPCISLRFPRARPSGVDALVALGAVSADLAPLLRELVGAKRSFVVTGGTGAGKTTVLSALLSECSADERLLVVEDVRELVPDHPHVVGLQGRGANVEGVGAVTLADLVRQALRMRPDRLVVGEVRGAEVRELLAALNTGHEGGASTVHANGPDEVPARLEALAALAGMPRDAVHAQLRGAMHVVVHVTRSDGRRRVESIGVFGSRVDGSVEVSVAARPVPGGLARGPGHSRLVGLVPGAAACRWVDP
ncbi:MAG: TadA family conjugal transfer-associated ATPase [Ornithinibacter sp.]